MLSIYDIEIDIDIIHIEDLLKLLNNHNIYFNNRYIIFYTLYNYLQLNKKYITSVNSYHIINNIFINHSLKEAYLEDKDIFIEAIETLYDNFNINYYSLNDNSKLIYLNYLFVKKFLNNYENIKKYITVTDEKCLEYI